MDENSRGIYYVELEEGITMSLHKRNPLASKENLTSYLGSLAKGEFSFNSPSPLENFLSYNMRIKVKRPQAVY